MMGSPANLSPPTAPPSPGSVTSNVDAVVGPGTWGRNGGPSSGGHVLSPPAARELAADDAPPELDALRPTFSKATRIPRRRVPVTLAPVGVGGDSSPLPSLFSATTSTASDPVPAGWVNSQWKSQHTRIIAGKDLGPPSVCAEDAAPALGPGMRARTDTDPGPSKALLEAAKVAASIPNKAVSPSLHDGSVGGEGSRRRSYTETRSMPSGAEKRHDSLGGEAGRLNRSAPNGGEVVPGVGGSVDGFEGGHQDQRYTEGGYDPAMTNKYSNGFPVAVAGGGSSDNTPGGSNSASGGNGTSATAGRSSGVRIRGGGIDITSLLSEGGDADAGGRGDTSGSGAGGNSSTYHGVRGYHSQDSNASSVGESAYGHPGGPRSGSGTPSHTASADFRPEWPEGRPPLVRKRSLTVAMDEPGGGGSANCPSPRGRRRSLERASDMADPNRLESPSYGQRVLATTPRGHEGSGGAVGGGVGLGGTVGGAGGSVAAREGCFSPQRHFGAGSGGLSGGTPTTAGAGGGVRDGTLASPCHDRFGQSSVVPVSGSSGGSVPSILAGGGSVVPNSVQISGVTSSGTGANNAMDVDWGSADNNPHTVSPPVSAATPSPVPSLSSVPSGSMLARSPGPFAPSPGREYIRSGGALRAPQSPSPRRAPPSPATAPGSAGLRRRGTRRLAGSRAGGRGGHMRVRSGSLGRGSFGAAGEVGGSGTYESDYDSDLSEASAYSAMGSLERQLQQDTFFELDESLWVVVTRREICTAEKCVYRNPQTMVSVRKHYHATCSHIHQEGVKKGMRFHHHQLEKVKKHQRSHSSHQARVPREPGMAPQPVVIGRVRSLEAQSSRDGISSGGEDDGDEEDPWSPQEIEQLDSLVRSYGTGNWHQVSSHYPNRNASQCARQWALGSRVQPNYRHHHVSSSSGAGGAAVAAAHGRGWGGQAGPGERGHGSAQDSVALSSVSRERDIAGRGDRGGPVAPGRQGTGVPAVGAATYGSSTGSGSSSTRGPKGVGSWTKEEDDRLNALVAAFGVKWSQISDHMPGRVGKQCRERYLNHLDPSLRHGPWTEEEEALLLSLHAKLNNQWAEIARQIPGRSDNDVKNRWNLVCRRERAAEKNLQRASSNAAAGSSKSGGSAGPGGGNSNGNGNDTAGNSGGGGGGEGGGSSSGGSSEATPGRESPKGAAGSTSSPAASGDTDPRVEEDGNPPGPDESTGSTRTRSPDSDGVQEGGAARLSSSRGAAKAVKMEERATAAASTSTAKERGERGLRDEKPRVSVEDPSVIEAREAAEAGAGLVKLSLTAASAARAALEHSNFESGGTVGTGSAASGTGSGSGASGGSTGVGPTCNSTTSNGGAGAGGIAPGGTSSMKRPPTPPVSPRFTRGHPPQTPFVSPRFTRGPSFHQPHPSPGAASPSSRAARVIGHPPRSPPRSGQTLPTALPGLRQGAGIPPPQSPYSSHATSSGQTLTIPRSPASENLRASARTPPSNAGTRRHQGVADIDGRRAAIAARAGSNGGVAAWPWGGRV